MESRRILVRSPNWIGDCIFAEGFFAGLRAAYPKAHITLACPAEFEPLADRHYFNRVVPLTKAQRKVPQGVAFWMGPVRKEKFDLGITLAASLSAAVLLKCAGITERVGFAERSADFFLTRSKRWLGRAAGEHKAKLYEGLLPLVGATPVEVTRSYRRGPKHPFIVFAPGASIALREWPHFVALAEELRRLHPEWAIRVVGTAAQQEWGKKFEALGDEQVENWVGMTTLAELIELCEQAQFVVANDSGVAHLSATLAGAATVVLFGPGDPAYVVPQGPKVRVARALDVICSPCESARCHARLGYQACLKRLDVDRVVREIESLN